MNNIKDWLTTICGLLSVIGGGILTAVASGQFILSDTVLTIIGIIVSISLGVIGFFQGRNADGSAKKPAQLADQK